MNLALVHDWLNQRGGAEDVLEQLVALYPHTPIHTSIFAPDLMPPAYRSWDIRTTWLDRLPGIHRHHQRYLPLYPPAWQGVDASASDLVLSNKSGFCHGLRTGNALHICYCLAPTRYIWNLEGYLDREQLGTGVRLAARLVARLYRRWDYAAAQRVDRFIAISTEIHARIRRYYRRESEIIYPPVDTQRFEPAPSLDEYFLVVSRLVPYKRIDVAVDACTRLGVPLVVAGAGRDRARLEALAGPSVTFLGYVPDDDLPALFARCRALLFPGLEDFGITPLQAMAAGRPVIAFRGGGALDTIIPGQTGVLFEQQTVEALVKALQGFDASEFSPAALRAHAQRFDSAVFREKITRYVDSAWDEARARRP